MNTAATAEIYTLSLHDALPILRDEVVNMAKALESVPASKADPQMVQIADKIIEQMEGPFDPSEFRDRRSEEHTSELQSRQYLVCRLLLEKKKTSMLMSRSPTIE